MKSITLLLAALLLPILAPAQVAVPDATYLQRAKVKDADKREVFSAKLYDNKLKLEYLDATGETITLTTSRRPSDGKRKFRDESGGTVAEIKLADDGFKLRDANGKLLWKIKLYPDKIKISDNEEGQDPFELRIDHAAGRTKIGGPKGAIAVVKFYPERKEQKVKPPDDAERTLLDMNTDRLAPWQGVLVLESIPLPQRAILAAELALRDLEKR